MALKTLLTQKIELVWYTQFILGISDQDSIQPLPNLFVLYWLFFFFYFFNLRGWASMLWFIEEPLCFLKRGKNKNKNPPFQDHTSCLTSNQPPWKCMQLGTRSEKAEKAQGPLQLPWGSIYKARSRIPRTLRTQESLKFNGMSFHMLQSLVKSVWTPKEIDKMSHRCPPAPPPRNWCVCWSNTETRANFFLYFQ